MPLRSRLGYACFDREHPASLPTADLILGGCAKRDRRKGWHMEWLAKLFTKYPEMGVYLAVGIG